MKDKIFSVLVVLLLASVVFVSGCVESTGLKMLIGSTRKKEAPSDVLKIQDLSVVPGPPITADSNFELSYQVVNIGSAEKGDKVAENVEAYIYDWGLCKPIHERGNIVRRSKVSGIEGQPVKIYPGGAQMVSQDFKTPTNERLGNMKGECPIRFKVNYDYDAHSTTSLNLVSEERLREAARAGESIGANVQSTKSRGPIKISLTVDGDQPMSSESIIPVTIKVNDVGTGLYKEVERDSLELTFPEDFSVSCYPSEWMSSAQPTQESRVVTNDKSITLIKGKTPAIRCDLEYKGPKISTMKTFTLRADMDYTYSVYGETSVSVKPTYQPLSPGDSSEETKEETTSTVVSEETSTTVEETTTITE